MHLTGDVDERLLDEVLLNEQPGPSTARLSSDDDHIGQEMNSDDDDEEDDEDEDGFPRHQPVVSQAVLQDATASLGVALASASASLLSQMDHHRHALSSTISSISNIHHAAIAAAAAANVANVAAARQAVGLPQQLSFPTGQSPLFPLDMLQAAPLHPAAGFLVPHTAYLLPGTQQLACHCMYNNGTQPCAVHHPPIAYGQASSAFPIVASSSSGTGSSLSLTQSSVQQVTRPVAQNPPSSHSHQTANNSLQPSQSSLGQQIQPLPQSTTSSQQTIQNTPISSVLSLPPVPIQSSLPPTLPHSMRSVTMRLKRTAPHQTQLTRLSSKVRRVEGRPSGDAELSPNEPPSTSQLQRSPSLSINQLPLCSACQEGARAAACLGCVPCHHCVYCQHHPPPPSASSTPQGLSHPLPSSANGLSQTMTNLIHCAHAAAASASHHQGASLQSTQNPVGVQQVQRDPLQQTHTVSASAASLQEQALLHMSRFRTLNEAIWTRQLSAFDPTGSNMAAATQLATSQAQLVAPFTLRQLSLTSPPLFVVPRSGFPSGIQNATRLDAFVLAALPSEFVDVRPLERQHGTAVFGGQPVAEPQPIGASLADIEKFSQRSEFVKDVEVPENEKERCTVCLMEFETGEGVRTLRCTHLFHVDCIDKWLVYNKKCPVCRVEVDCQSKTLLVV